MSASLAVRLIGGPVPRYSELLAAAEKDDSVFLPRIEPGWVGAAIALLGLAIGVLWVRSQPAAGDLTVGWVALAMVLVGMLIQLTRRRISSGWQVDLLARSITPVGLSGQALQLGDGDYAIVCTAGDRKRSLAIDVRQAEGRRMMRLFQTPGPVRLADHRTLSALADVLARRLNVGRDGLTV